MSELTPVEERQEAKRQARIGELRGDFGFTNETTPKQEAQFLDQRYYSEKFEEATDVTEYNFLIKGIPHSRFEIEAAYSSDPVGHGDARKGWEKLEEQVYKAAQKNPT